MKKVFRHEGELFSALIANSDDGVTDVLKADDKSWHPFFNKTFTDGVLTSVDMPPATVGFFIASHYFLLAEGQRTVAVTFTASGFKGTIGQEYATGVLCSLSGEKGWFDVQPTSFKATNATTIVLQVVVDGDQPAVVASDTKLHAITIDTPTPLLKLTFQHIDGEDFLFELFEDVAIGTVTVNVSVDRVRALTLSNDFGPVDASKPFQPFGAQPEAGSSFVIGSQEIFSKRNLNTCQLILNWKNIPNFWVIAYRLYEESFSKFIDYYNKPFDLASAIEYIFYALSVPQVMVQALSQGVWNVGTLRNIFDSDSSITIDIKPPSNAFNVNDESDFQVDDAYAVTTKNAFMRLNLTSGFGHVQFRDALADYALDVASGGSPVKPTAPYTPEVDSIYATYSATQTFQCDTSDEDVFNNRQARLFHITDFGFAEQHAVLKQDTPDTAVYLFPQLRHSNQFDDAIPDGQSVVHEAEFFIGVKGLVPPQTLTFLFQCVDGTANPLSLKPDPHIQWSYLQNNEWMPFQANDVQDNTAELLESGIVTLSVPREATSDNTLFTTGLHWFRLAVEKNSDAVCSLILVATQALEVDLQDVAVDAVVEALAANTISKLEKPVAAVKKVSQPSPTFGGKSAEDPNDFYARISERLRHKDRAITIWDYEHLVLEAYPEIYRVKCLNHTQYEPSDDVTGIYKELAPGHVTIITIPDQIGQNEANPLKPYTSLGLLEEIYDYLKARLTCFATLHVRNPQFEEVRVDFKVRLYDGFDETFYVNKLKESITQFLSPWAYSNIEHPSFGGKIYQSVLVDFVEEQEYVDYVTDFHLFHDIGGVQSTVSRQFVEGSRAVSILVSVPASKHTITVIDPIEEEVSLEECGCDE